MGGCRSDSYRRSARERSDAPFALLINQNTQLKASNCTYCFAAYCELISVVLRYFWPWARGGIARQQLNEKAHRNTELNLHWRKISVRCRFLASFDVPYSLYTQNRRIWSKIGKYRSQPPEYHWEPVSKSNKKGAGIDSKDKRASVRC